MSDKIKISQKICSVKTVYIHVSKMLFDNHYCIPWPNKKNEFSKLEFVYLYFIYNTAADGDNEDDEDGKHFLTTEPFISE